MGNFNEQVWRELRERGHGRRTTRPDFRTAARGRARAARCASGPLRQPPLHTCAAAVRAKVVVPARRSVPCRGREHNSALSGCSQLSLESHPQGMPSGAVVVMLLVPFGIPVPELPPGGSYGHLRPHFYSYTCAGPTVSVAGSGYGNHAQASGLLRPCGKCGCTEPHSLTGTPALSTSSCYGDQRGSADSGSVTKSMSRSTAPTSAGSRSA